MRRAAQTFAAAARQGGRPLRERGVFFLSSAALRTSSVCVSSCTCISKVPSFQRTRAAAFRSGMTSVGRSLSGRDAAFFASVSPLRTSSVANPLLLPKRMSVCGRSPRHRHPCGGNAQPRAQPFPHHAVRLAADDVRLPPRRSFQKGNKGPHVGRVHPLRGDRRRPGAWQCTAAP